jgi:hypothetical protein
MSGGENLNFNMGSRICVQGPTRDNKTASTTHKFEVICDNNPNENFACGLLDGEDEMVCLPKEAFFSCSEDSSFYSEEDHLFKRGEAYVVPAQPAREHLSWRNSREAVSAATDKLVKKLTITPEQLNDMMKEHLGYTPVTIINIKYEEYDIGGYCTTLYDNMMDIVFYLCLPKGYGVNELEKGFAKIAAHHSIYQYYEELAE